MKGKHRKTIEAVYTRPVPANIKWRAIERMLRALGAEISEHEGSRIGIYQLGEIRVFHRLFPSPDIDKGAVESIRRWLEKHRGEWNK